MTIDGVLETVLPANLTVEQVFASSGAELDEDQFTLIADFCMRHAATAGGESQQRMEAFDAMLEDRCAGFGDSIKQRFVLVAYPKLVGSKWRFVRVGARLNYFSTDADGYRYIASVFPS